jgi:microspherule protein 1
MFKYIHQFKCLLFEVLVLVDILLEPCSSSRSIKRRRFDDELVESSLGTPGNLASKVARARTQSNSSPGLSQYNTTYSSRVPATPSTSCAPG